MIVIPYSWGFVSEKQLEEHGIFEGKPLELTIEKLSELVTHFSIMLKSDKNKSLVMFIDEFGKRFSQR